MSQLGQQPAQAADTDSDLTAESIRKLTQIQPIGCISANRRASGRHLGTVGEIISESWAASFRNRGARAGGFFPESAIGLSQRMVWLP
jgi:hypothetical protein